MLTVKREQQGNTLILRLAGEINESVNFKEAIGPLAPDTVISGKEVSRLNSMGVKGWVMYFQSFTAQGIKLRLIECSPAIVEQLNLIMNFAAGGRVESIYVPFACTTCKKSLVGLFKVADLQQSNFALPPVKCNKCGSEAIFDDLPEEYFGFAKRT